MAVVSFFTPEEPMRVADVCATIGCAVPSGIGSTRTVQAVDSVEKAVSGDLTFAASGKMRGALSRLRDVTVICTEALASAVPESCAVIVHKHPAQAFHRATRALYPASLRSPDFSGLVLRPDGSAVHPSARLERGVILSAGVVIGAHCEIGAGTRVSPGARIAPGSTIGRNCDIGMNVVVQCAHLGDGVIIGSGTVIGHDGFGYVPGLAGLDKVPQLGRVILQNRVEIGANCCIDRGALDDTVIGEGTKIDNLVQIAHNVRIGRHCVIAAMCGLAGSVTVGDGTMLGGQVGVVDHISIGRNVRLAAMTGVLSDIDDNSELAGMPARPVRAFFREALEVKKLAERRGHVKAAPSGTNGED